VDEDRASLLDGAVPADPRDHPARRVAGDAQIEGVVDEGRRVERRHMAVADEHHRVRPSDLVDVP
jgi:hypothetical protein